MCVDKDTTKVDVPTRWILEITIHVVDLVAKGYTKVTIQTVDSGVVASTGSFHSQLI